MFQERHYAAIIEYFSSVKASIGARARGDQGVDVCSHVLDTRICQQLRSCDRTSGGISRPPDELQRVRIEMERHEVASQA